MTSPRPHASRAAVVVVSLAVLAAACGGSTATSSTTSGAPTSTSAPTTTLPPTTSTTEVPPAGGEVVVGLLEEPASLSPFGFEGISGVVATIGAGVWVGAAKVDGETLELVPDLLVTLPSVANGGLVVNADGTETVSYEIDPRAVWADGVPISGDDFRFTYEQVMLSGVEGVDRSGYDLILPESIVAEPKGFRFTIARPSLAVESLFSIVLPAHIVEGTDLVGDWADEMWVSGGPFSFDQWSRGEFLTLVRNPNYWKTDETGDRLPYLDRVVFRFVPDVDTLVAEFRERRIDVITPGWDPALFDEMAALDGVTVDVAGTGQWEHLAFQFGDGRLARNPGSYNEHLEYRLAVAHALDRQAIADALFGGWGIGLESYVEASTPGWSSAAWAQYDFDPDRARDYLTQLCAKDGVDCADSPPTAVFTTAEQRGELSLALEAMLTGVGIAYRAELEPRVVFLGETLEFGTFDLSDWSWAGTPGLEGLVALHRAWDPRQAPPTGTNYYRFGSPAYQGEGEFAAYHEGPSSLIDESTARMAEIVDLLATTVDEVALRGLLTEAESILAAEVVFVPLFQTPDAGIVWSDEIEGYRHYPAIDTWNLATWRRANG